MSDCHLYLITPPLFEPLAFSRVLGEALDAAAAHDLQVACLQLRMKDVADDVVLDAAFILKPVLEKHQVALILNDRPDLAKRAGADGVHMGQTDGSIREARALLGDDADIGVTCHDSRHLAMIAAEDGADYVAFGAFYPTTTKATSHRPEPEILSAWSQMTLVPCVAIGGITPANAAPLVNAGADYLAVSHAVWGHRAGAGDAMVEFALCLRRPPNVS